jgi:hypothetical protein
MEPMQPINLASLISLAVLSIKNILALPSGSVSIWATLLNYRKRYTRASNGRKVMLWMSSVGSTS